MPSNLTSLCRRAVSRPFNAVRRQLRAGRASGAATDKRADPETAPHDDPERLERIAAYARAGYFNIGYTLEMFHVAGEVAPE